MKVLVVGAGVAGLAMRRVLSLWGVSHRIIDSHPIFPVRSAYGISLPSNAVECLGVMGLSEEIKSTAKIVPKITYKDFHGRVLTEFQPTLKETGFNPFYGTTRSNLINILHGHSREAVDVLSVLNAIEEEDGFSVFFSDGSLEKYDLIIKATGQNPISRINSSNLPLDDLGVVSARFMLKNLLHIDNPIYFFDSNQMVMLYPVGKDEIYCYLQKTDDSYLKSDFNTFNNLFDSFSIRDQVLSFFINEFKKAPSCDIYFDRVLFSKSCCYLNGGIVNIGDSAHVFTPILQQGAAQALKDALILGELIASSDNRNDFYQSFDKKFLKDRLKEVNWILQQSSVIAKNMSFKGIDSFTVEKTPVAQAWHHIFSKNCSTHAVPNCSKTKKTGDSIMLKLMVKYTLNTEGAKKFNSWFPRLKEALTKRNGYISIDYNHSEGNVFNIILLFDNQENLTQWAKSEDHKKLDSEMRCFFSEPVSSNKEIISSPDNQNDSSFRP